MSKRDVGTTILRERVSIPVGISPSAMQRMAHPEGECANVRGMPHLKTFSSNIFA